MNELLLISTIAGRRCAFRAVEISSVIEIGPITPIPQTGDAIIGMAALRSQVLTVIDCRLAIGLAIDDLPSDARAAVVSVEGHSYALVVDSIEDIAESASQVAEIIGGFGPNWAAVAQGIIETSDGPALLLDIDRLIDCPKSTERVA